ncbi:hypothetical protein GJ699_20990 [Duganella sp. FT80W]|uniref:Uncharacterized protein n=1 Tax=Duganella guangzhouensis TaxID=2666084 RepID=A0A6I2L871_9BURK|nr:hypothetical protein [Duganella guangzhouensis]MRW92479.1 hypothetical protein [Duganella guangzhouensis]
MTTPHDHTPYLDQLDDPHAFWEQRIKACRWMIAKTLGLGAIAAALGVLGQGWLEHAAPLLPIISQNYGIWQTAYVLSLILIFLVWAAAMRQKMGLLENSKQGLAMQNRIDEHNARIEERRRATRERREELAKEREERSIYHKASGGRSNKFDY